MKFVAYRKDPIEDMKLIKTIMDNREKPVGYILLPTIEGFDVFEMDAEKLELYMHAECVHLELFGK